MELSKEEIELINYCLKQEKLEANKQIMKSAELGMNVQDNLKPALDKIELLINKFEKETTL